MNKILDSVSSRSGKSSRSSFNPEREDIFKLQRMGRHTHVQTLTRLKGQEFGVVTTSLTGLSINTVRRAVFYLECLRNARWVCAALSQEMELMHQEMRDMGLILDDDFPPALREFFDTDPGQVRAQQTPPERQEYLEEDRLRILLTQLLGLIPHSS